MTGVEIVGQLLGASAAFNAIVPSANLDYWDLPQGNGLPNVILTSISRSEQQFLSAQSTLLVIERAQATIRTANGAQRETIRKALRDACRDKRPTVAGITSVSVLLAGDGPDFMDDDASIFMGSVDLRVSWNEPA